MIKRKTRNPHNNSIITLLVFAPYYPPHIGGLESHAYEFNEELSKLNYKINVFTPLIPGTAKVTEKQNDKVMIYRYPAFEIIPNYPFPKFWAKLFWQQFNKAKKEKPDIVISRTRFFLSSFMAMLYAKPTRTKWVHIEHGSSYVELSSKFSTYVSIIYDNTVGRMIFRLCDVHVAISHAVKEFIKNFDKRESPVIYRGLNLKEIDDIQPNKEIKEKYKDKVIITFGGRLYKWKGVEDTVKAIKSLSTEYKKQVVYLIIGDGEDLGRIKQLVNNDSAIVMLGQKPREVAISIIKASDIYIHSSNPGGALSSSLLEAMYCENAIIATPNEGAKEVINKDTGILIKGKETKVKEIQDSIIMLLNNRNLINEHARNAKAYIEENFSWEESIEKYRKLL